VPVTEAGPVVTVVEHLLEVIELSDGTEKCVMFHNEI